MVILATALIPICVYFSYVFRYTLNIPHMDDYDAILGFLVNFKNADFADKLGLLFSQHNEHRILSSRIVYVLYYSLCGSVNFKNIIVINTLLLVGVFAVVAVFIKRVLPANWVVPVVILSFCLFDINNYDNAVFASYGMQNYGIVLWFVSSMLCYTGTKRWYLLPAALLQILCVYSSGNGILASLFILLSVCLTRDRVKIVTALAVFLIFSPLYYLHYQQPETNFFTTDITKIVPYFLHAAGAHFGFDAGVAAGGIMIVVLLAAMAYAKKLGRLPGSAMPLVCLAGFVLASLSVMSVFRGNMPVGNAYTSRYFIYGHLLLVLSFVFALLCVDNQKIIMAEGVVMAIVVLFIYKADIDDGEKAFQYYYNSLKNIQYDYPIRDKAKAIAESSCQEQVYCIEDHRGDE